MGCESQDPVVRRRLCQKEILEGRLAPGSASLEGRSSSKRKEWDAVKAMLRGKRIALNAHIRKKEELNSKSVFPL